MDELMYNTNRHLAAYLNNNLTKEKEYILVIINKNGNHWILGLINLRNKIISILDSMREINHDESFRKLFMIADLTLIYQDKRADFNEFKFYCSLNNPMQTNFDDCGVFVCRYIRNILEKNDHNFTILTGEYREEINKVLNNQVIPLENRSRTIPSVINYQLNRPGYLPDINNLTIRTEVIDYRQLINVYYDI